MTARRLEDADGIVARSPAMRAVLALVDRLAATRTPALVEGESGAGKDLIAHRLHFGGPRRDGPFVTLHCPSVPDTLMEDELFGHERGAFTDARHARAGKLEMADRGTLYFDQVHDLSPALQAKLLRVVEERRFERLGGTRTVEIDVRFVASSTVNLRDAVAAGTFREDLYHRLGVVPVSLPPLRERPEDLAPLAELFLRRERERGTTTARGFDTDASALLRGYRWPGNVRELRGVVERAALLTRGTRVTSAALPGVLFDVDEGRLAERPRPPSLRELERAYIRHVLAAVDGSQTRAARILGISRKALWEKRRRLGLP